MSADRQTIVWRRRPDVAWPTVGQNVGGVAKRPFANVATRHRPPDMARRWPNVTLLTGSRKQTAIHTITRTSRVVGVEELNWSWRQQLLNSWSFVACFQTYIKRNEIVGWDSAFKFLSVFRILSRKNDKKLTHWQQTTMHTMTLQKAHALSAPRRWTGPGVSSCWTHGLSLLAFRLWLYKT